MFTELEHRPIRFLYEATLSNGAEIFVLPDARAIDESGVKYKAVNNFDADGDLIQVGWEKEE